MLLHFTKSFDALASILARGFLFLHNETGVLRPAARDAFGIEIADEQSSGMACFTEMKPRDAHAHREKYGQFGVGVSKEWLVEQGAKKVTYVEVGSPSYLAYVQRLRALAPRSFRGRPINECLMDPDTSFDATLALTKPIHAHLAAADRKYIALLQHLQWTQTSKDLAEKEWRIRNPRPYAYKGRPSRKEFIDLLLHCLTNPAYPERAEGLMQVTLDLKTILMFGGKEALVLPLPVKKVEAIFSTPEHRSGIAESLKAAGISHIKLIT